MADSDSTNREFREEVLTQAIKRMTGVDEVVFEDDDEHVVIGPREGEYTRYRLGTVAQQVLSGEFPLAKDEELPVVTLHAPGGKD